ncbi:hypothetical protein N7462_001914 [Penicillium macrosclerotiorum]|uniref:uncharacterized protein n=1 Tax=Penicillium macrosclerotiorum TaxID=303699 RepID=UPI00254841C6|nr:uncharacterized protein N7462_001914 [Penicillium macrosclerotiorum]KAJ5692491.1 hypothetical protein N7462_001914 [Penicillium macrosclerotiorum]
MADPISITGLIMDVSNIVASLINYAKAVQSAKSEMRKLSEELFALKGILEYLSANMPNDKNKSFEEETEREGLCLFNHDVVERVLKTTSEFLQALLKDLEEPASRFRKLKQKLEWPFTQDQVNEHLVRLERVKSWLILVLTADHATADRELHHEIGGLARTLKEDLQLRHEERNEKFNQELFTWLSPVSPSASHLQASKGHRAGTGKWFIDGHLNRWLRDTITNKQVFFLVGKSGAGKTTIFAQTVDDFTSRAVYDASINLAYFYCTISNTASQTLVNILGSLVVQLSASDPSILDNIKASYEKIPQTSAHRLPIEIPTLEDAIVKSSSEKRQSLIFVDAINESPQTEKIENCLLRLATLSPNIRIFVTTTTTTASPKVAHILNLNADKMRGDIDAFIKYRLERDETLRSLPLKLKNDIEQHLLQTADGSFRWVQLSMDNLKSQRTARSMRQALNDLPGTLRETYATTLERISPEDWHFAREALFWLCFVRSPLTLAELNEAVVHEEQYTVLEEDSMLVPRNILLEICQGLVVQDQSGFVHLAHSSVKEFLTSDWICTSKVSYFSLNTTTVDATIMRKCLTYLCLDNFKDGYVASGELEDILGRKRQHPFLRYAAFYWPHHASSCDFGESERMLVNRFFDTKHLFHRGNFGVWVQMLIPGVDASVIETTQPLYYAASFGMVSVVNAILKSDPEVDINARGGRVGATPLFAACWRHNYEVAEILLKAGANPALADPGTGSDVFHLSRTSKYKALRGILRRCGAI